MALRWVALAVGLFVLLSTTFSVVGTLVVPRGIDSPISKACERLVDATFLLITRPVRTYVRRDRILAWQGPVGLLLRLAVWIGLIVVGFALVLLPVVPGSAAHSFSEAGSSMFTLGYSAPTNASSTLIDYVAAYTGLVVVGLQIGYLPTLYSAFNRRETEVTLLISRAGVPAWGPEILGRTRYGIADGDVAPVLDKLFESWERWFAELGESHTTYLVLVRLRSPRPLSHWLTSAIAIMDAAAMHLALAPSAEPKLSARLALRMGFVALGQIARTMGISVNEDPDPDGPISVSYEQFADAVEQVRAVGYPIERSVEQAWQHYRGWRVNYDSLALALARAVDAPPALWTGDRRWPSTPIAPLRPANRPPKDARPGS